MMLTTCRVMRSASKRVRFNPLKAPGHRIFDALGIKIHNSAISFNNTFGILCSLLILFFFGYGNIACLNGGCLS
jgi:hypothetical protein